MSGFLFMYTRHQVGRDGEQQAVEYLQDAGYEILDRNVLLRWAEIDVIARICSRGEEPQGTSIHFFEVKRRSSLRHGSPFDAIRPAKLQKIQMAAQYYMAQHAELAYDRLAIGVIGQWYDEQDGVWKLRCIPNIEL